MEQPYRRIPGPVTIAAVALLCMAWPTGALGETIAPGVTYTFHQIAGPRQVFVVSIERGRPEYKFEVGWPQQRRNYTSRARTSTIANLYDSPPGHDVLAAVNGSFFGSGNIVIGATASAGEMLEHPTSSYDTLLFGPSRRPGIRESVAHAAGRITFASGSTTPLDDYNKARSADRIVAYTPQWAPTTGTSVQGVEVILSSVSYPMRSHKEVSGIVTAIRTGSSSINNSIPAGGMVLSAQGTGVEATLTSNIQVGHRLHMRFATNAGEYNNADMAISGAGWLVKDGVANTANWSRQSSSFVNDRHPRTVFGWSDTHYHMMVVDGRTTTSIGMNFQQMADFLIGTLGCDGAVNLDGGGSSTMWVNGSVRNNPSDGSERSVGNAVLLVRQDTGTALPFTDSFAADGRAAGWDDKFTYNPVVSFAPTAPGGDGYAVVVSDPAGGVETMRRGDWGDADYAVQADIYCEYRPDVAANGYERYALFARDDGIGGLGLTTSSYGAGNCYVMTYDSNNGRLRAGKHVNGTLTDFRAANPLTLASTAWRRFRIECLGNRIRYFLNGTEIANVIDNSFASGYFGIGYHELFSSNANIRGTRADNFLVTLPDMPPAKATGPSPAHLAVDVPHDSLLSWTAGQGADSHRVNFGTTSPGSYRGSQAGTSFNPGPLTRGQTYYWRIDEVNPIGTTTGDVWQFTALQDAVPADHDHDGDVDLDDFSAFQICLTGNGQSVTDPDCFWAKLDGDGDADAVDLSLFLACLSGPGLPPPAGCGSSLPPTSPIPPRPADAPTGSQFVNEVLNLSLLAREARIREELLSGNLPDFLRTFVPVTVSQTIDGQPYQAVYHVAPDYLAIGSDADFVRMPMMPDSAQVIADRFECTLTTRKMTNTIYTQAAVKLAPSPINPQTTDITLVSTFYQHHQTVEQQRAGQPLGLLIGGIKKDVVITPQLLTLTGRVAIYGWHQLNGTPIQPLYLGHNIYHVDYSHGIRLVSAYMTVNGQPMTTADVLAHPQLHVLLSDEGQVVNPRYE